MANDLSTDHRALWPYDTTAKPVPAGWSIDVNFDDRFLKGVGSGESPGDVGGAVTHTHDFTDHTHPAASHFHSFSAASASTTANDFDVESIATQPEMLMDGGSGSHTHASQNGSAVTANYDDAVGLTTGTANNAHGAAIKTIIIKPAAAADVPDDGVAFTDLGAAPSGWEIADGTQGADYADLNGLQLLGESTGSQGGASVAAVAAGHDHGSLAGGGVASHVHTASSHLHGSAWCGASSQEQFDDWQKSGGISDPSVQYTSGHHLVSLASGTSPDTLSAKIPIASDGSLAPEIKLLAVVNTSGAASTPERIIVPYVGTLAALDTDRWELCEDAADRVVTATTSSIEVGDTAGSKIPHQHTVTNHTHTAQSHTHTVAGVNNKRRHFTQSAPVATGVNAHSHTWTIDAATETLTAMSVTMTAEDMRYKWRNVYWVRRRSVRTVIRGGAAIRGGAKLGAA